jgi:putative membrane protein
MWSYGPQGGMMGWGGYGGGAPFGMIIWTISVIAIVAAAIWLLRSRGFGGNAVQQQRSSPGLTVLEERYARGEINRDEYLQKRRDIGL